MDVTSLMSAFIGSLLGVMSGFMGAVYLEWNRNRRERRTHILALMREMLSNNVRIQLLLKEGRREGSLDDRAWRELRVVLAGELSTRLYNRVATRYDAFGSMRQVYEEVADGDGDEEQHEKLRMWADEMMRRTHSSAPRRGDREQGLLRALRRRERRHAERQENSNAGTKARS